MTSLEDRAEIIDLTHRYCWALDAREFDLLDSVFAEDAEAELLAPVLAGREAIVGRVSGAVSRFDATWHAVSNHQIALDGDTATCRCYLMAQHVKQVDGEARNFVIAGRYEDRLRRDPQGWRIVFRRLVRVWTEGDPGVRAR